MKAVCCSAALSGDGIATVVAALIAAAAVVATIVWDRRRQRETRRAEAFAVALQAVSDYLEAPYLIRRRTRSDRGALTQSISDIQSRLAFHQAHLALIDASVSSAFDSLVREAKREAGAQMKEAWESKPLRRDKQMSIAIAFPQPGSAKAREQVVEAMRRSLR